MDFLFFLNSVLLGAGLAADAFTVSLANGMRETRMKIGRMFLIAGSYAVFQFAMPMTGWVCVHTIVEIFHSFVRWIPWIALALLLFLGIRMICTALRGGVSDAARDTRLTFGALMIQSIATSIDALSVGFTIAEYGFAMALVCSLIIAAVTLGLCMGGLQIGKKSGTVIGGKAGIVGGTILIFIGIEIFIKGIFF